jgi:thioredoxin reductase (NADPH)
MPTNNPDTLNLAVIGGGPAALTAALYAARAGLKVKVFERAVIGGALAEISDLSNYPGYAGPGPALAEQMRAQAVQAGAEIIYAECQKLWHYADFFELTLDDGFTAAGSASESSSGAKVRAKKVLVATGSDPKKLSFAPKPPVSYCALCDGALAKDKHVAVIGGANSAVQESLYLANLVKDLTIITHSHLKADLYLQRRLESVQKTHDIKILENTEATPDLLNTFDYVFVFIGKRPATAFLRPLADSLLPDPTGRNPLLDSAGYILTNPATAASSTPGLPEATHNTVAHNITAHSTVVPGLYAAGDVRSGSLKQVVTAAADGASAAIEILESLNLSTPE